jgi:hypothetical protein
LPVPQHNDDLGNISGELRALIAELESTAKGTRVDRGQIATALDGMAKYRTRK